MDFTEFIATSTAAVGAVGEGVWTGFWALIETVMPYALGILVFIIGVRWVMGALGGRAPS